MIPVITIFLLIYALFIMYLIIGWGRIKEEAVNAPEFIQPFVSVIIPVRNEAGNIVKLLQDLEKQTYPPYLFEVIVMDDHSTDETLSIIKDFRDQSDLNLKIHQVNQVDENSPKKRALDEGIAKSKGQFIMTTDGDCRLGEYWISTMVSRFNKPEIHLAFGPVTCSTGRSIISRVQTMELNVLVYSGASSLAMGIPSMCNGANLAFRKSTFQKVNGYRDNRLIASGDDEFLMHKIYKTYPDGIAFVKELKALVITTPESNWRMLYYQKKRWAGKFPHYIFIKTKLLAAFVFALNLCWVLLWPSWLTGLITFNILLISISVKALLDFMLSLKVQSFFKQPVWLAGFLWIEIFYPLYIVFFGMISRVGKYHWKNRVFDSQPSRPFGHKSAVNG